MSNEAKTIDDRTLWEKLMDGAGNVFEGIKRKNRLNKDKIKFKTALGNLQEAEVDLIEKKQEILSTIVEVGVDPNKLIEIKRDLRGNALDQQDVKDIYKELFGKTLKVDVD